MKVKIKLSKNKAVCRCDHCDELDEKITQTRPGTEARKHAQNAKRDHLRVASQQRKHFDGFKEKAMQKPLEQWTITFDGFDQSKTRLPHHPRLSKELDKGQRIGMHVVGAFVFGGPEPVQAFFNDDSVAKDSNLSATILFEILDRQWKALERTYDDQISRMYGEEAVRPDDAGYQGQRSAFVASGWPARLHITFDNTTSEAKNKPFFRTVAALVHWGVFEAITMSMLLVGHTHDIVDQMFSVWAILLRIKDVHTLQQMKELFRKHYHSRISAIALLFAQYRECFNGDYEDGLAEPAAGEAGMPPEPLLRDAGITLKEFCAYIDHGVGKEGPYGNADDARSVKKMAKARANMVDELLKGQEPKLYDINYSIDVKGWFAHNKDFLNPEFDKATDIAKPHVFAVEKNLEDGCTYIFSRYLANSIVEARPEEMHNCLGQRSGDYSSCVKAFDATSQLPHLPTRAAPQHVDVDDIGKVLRTWFQQQAISKAELEQNQSHLNQIGSRFEDLASACRECGRLARAIAAIGPISNTSSLTVAQKNHEKDKANEKNGLRRELLAHQHDPAFAKNHIGFSDEAWFGNWTKRSWFILHDYQLQKDEKLKRTA